MKKFLIWRDKNSEKIIKVKGEFMNKEIFDLVEKIFTFLKIGNYNKLKNILNIIEKDYPNYYKIFENF